MKPKDRVCIGPDLSERSRLAVRDRDGRLDTMIFRETKSGEPIPPGAEFVRVGPDRDGWRDVETIYKTGGPAQVATPAYRDGYDRIFGKQKIGLA